MVTFLITSKSGSTRRNESLCHALFFQILSGMDYMHRQCGLAHYDLKLENIVVDGHFGVKIIDFAYCEHKDAI
jgi:serine/threonine protein kinase